jgi:hypothetical protein
MTMRTLFFAVLLTLAFAGSAQAQQRVRTGPLRPAAAAPAAARAVPDRVVRQAKVQARTVVGRAKAGLSAAAQDGRTVRRQHAPRVKRPAPRG